MRNEVKSDICMPPTYFKCCIVLSNQGSYRELQRSNKPALYNVRLRLQLHKVYKYECENAKIIAHCCATVKAENSSHAFLMQSNGSSLEKVNGIVLIQKAH